MGNGEEAPSQRKPLASRSSSGGLIAGLLAGLDQALTNRPRPVAQIEEQYRDPWATAEGVTVDGDSLGRRPRVAILLFDLRDRPRPIGQCLVEPSEQPRNQPAR